MCSTIEALDKKNDKAHALIAVDITQIKQTMATKKDVELLKPKITAASSISGLQKAAIVFVTSLLVILGGISTFFIGQTYSSTKTSTSAQIHLNIILDSINQRLKESNAVAKNFDAKQIMDTLNVHWKDEQEFYQKEYLVNKKHEWDIYQDKILPTEQRSKQNGVVLKDHELRITKLEKRIK